jgi:translation initiation factor IF-1
MSQPWIEFDGTIMERLAADRYRVRFDNGHEVVAYTQDDAQGITRPTQGDRMTVEISPSDVNACRLIFRRKMDNA